VDQSPHHPPRPSCSSKYCQFHHLDDHSSFPNLMP